MPHKKIYRKIVPGALSDAYAMEGYLIKSILTLEKRRQKLNWEEHRHEIILYLAEIKNLKNTLAHLRRNTRQEKPF